jgi:hypothetical protein
VHGWDSDQAHYQNLSDEISALGCVCLTFDLRGHGKDALGHPDVSRGDNLQDVLAAYDSLVQTGLVDPTALAVIGTSYGGYLASIATSFSAAILPSRIETGMRGALDLAWGIARVVGRKRRGLLCRSGGPELFGFGGGPGMARAHCQFMLRHLSLESGSAPHPSVLPSRSHPWPIPLRALNKQLDSAATQGVGSDVGAVTRRAIRLSETCAPIARSP